MGLASIVVTVLCFSGYYFTAQCGQTRRIFVKTKSDGNDLIGLFLFRKITGFVFLGVIPAVSFMLIFNVSPVDLGFRRGEIADYSFWIGGCVFLILLLNFLMTQNPQVFARYPEIRVHAWTAYRLIISISGWALYLVAYEFLFRGILFQGCIQSYGMGVAIVLNLILYAAAHIMQGWRESVGSLIFGAVLCLITWATHSLFPAILLHLCLSVSSEIFAIYHNPDMKFGGKLINSGIGTLL